MASLNISIQKKTDYYGIHMNGTYYEVSLALGKQLTKIIKLLEELVLNK